MTQTYVVSLLLLFSSSLALSQTTAIVGGRIHTVSGEVIEEGTLLLEDGRIRAVGASVHIPSGARRIEGAGKIVTPGLIDVGTSIGLLEVKSLADTTDFSVGGEDAIRAAFRVSDGLNPHSIVIPITRLGGVTTVATMPSGGALSGQGAIIDLDGTTATDLIVRDPAALYGAFNPGAAESAGGARGALALLLRESLDDARYYAMNKNAYDRAALRSLSLSRLDLEALQLVLDKSVSLVLHASRAADIEAALRLAAEYELDLTIMGGEEAWRRREQLAATGTAVIVKAYRNLPIQFDQLGSQRAKPALRSRSGGAARDELARRASSSDAFSG